MQHAPAPVFSYPPPPPPPPAPQLVSLAARPELDRPVLGRTRRRLALPGGVLLFLAMFLPATRVCGERAVTGLDLLRFPPLVLPYLVGLLAALVVLAPVLRGLRGHGIALQLLTVPLMAGFGALAHLAALEPKHPVIGLAVIAWWAAAIAVRPALSARTPWERRAARTLAVMGFACTFWFGLFLVLDDGVLWGTGVAFVGALLVALGGVAWESELEGAFVSTPIPAARAR